LSIGPAGVRRQDKDTNEAKQSEAKRSERKREDTMSHLATIPVELTAHGSERRRIARSLARHLVTAARIALGLAFLVFGLNGFFNFIPPPTTPPPEGAMSFAVALMKTGYMFPLIKGTEVLAGLLLLSGWFVPLALILLAPVLVNIVAFHAFLAPEGSAVALTAVALEIALAWAYRDAYRPLFVARRR
jgi:uncharacterized membrane protein YphA (DoxX/SURF4 family)